MERTNYMKQLIAEYAALESTAISAIIEFMQRLKNGFPQNIRFTTTVTAYIDTVEVTIVGLMYYGRDGVHAIASDGELYELGSLNTQALIDICLEVLDFDNFEFWKY